MTQRPCTSGFHEPILFSYGYYLHILYWGHHVMITGHHLFVSVYFFCNCDECFHKTSFCIAVVHFLYSSPIYYRLSIFRLAIFYNMIIHTELQLQWYSFGQTLHSRMTPHHISPSRASNGVSFVKSSKKYDRDISRAHCIWMMHSLSRSVVTVSNRWSLCAIFSVWLL